MSEPAGLSMSLDDLIKKRSQGGRGGTQANRGGGRGGGGLSVRGGGVNKFSDRKGFVQRQGGEQAVQHTQQHRGGFGGRHGGPAVQQRRGGFGGRGGFGDRQYHNGGSAVSSSVQTYFDDNTGNVVVKLKETDVVSVSPSGEIVLNTGGWFTQTTLEVMNKALGVLQIRVTANGDVRDGSWQIAYGPHLLRFYDGIVLHPKNPATAAQRAPIVLAAMTGAALPAAAPVPGAGMGAAASMFAQPGGGAMGGMGANPLAASAAAASTAAALAAGVMARARAALGLGSTPGFGNAVPGVATAQQQQQYLAALAAQQNPTLALAGMTADQASADADVIRRLKAQGRL